MKRVLVIVLSFLLSEPSYGCESPVKYLQKGELTTCEGFLFSKEKELEVREQIEDYKSLLETSELHIQLQERLREQVILSDLEAAKEREIADLWRTKAIESSTKLIELERSNTWRDFGLVLGGVGLTALAGWTIGQVSK